MFNLKSSLIFTFIITFSFAACHSSANNKPQTKKQSTFAVIYTPGKKMVDSLQKLDENFSETYADCVNEETQVIKFLESKNHSVIITNERKFDSSNTKIQFEIKPLYSLALCVNDSIFYINEFSYSDFINEYNQHIR